MNKRLSAYIMTGALTLLLVIGMLATTTEPARAVTQAEIDEKNSQREGIQEQKSAIEAEIVVLQEQQESIVAQKNALDLQCELTRQDIEIILEQIALYTNIIAQKEEELERATEDERMQKERFRTRLRSMEENAPLTYLAIVFKATSFTDMLSRLDSISAITQYDKQLEDEYISAREHVETVKLEYETMKAEGEQIKAELEEERARLEREIEAAYTLIQQYEEEIQYNEELFLARAAEEERLESEIASMIAQLEQEIEAARKAAEQNNTNYTSSWTGATTTGTGQLQWPVSGSVTSGFGPRLHPVLGYNRPHTGIDISASSGTPIAAADSGTVITAGFNSGGYGNYVIISHGDGISTLYAHMTSYIVSVGQSVSKGDTIGYVGSTGLSSGPHLHFEVRINGGAVDPILYL